MLRAFIAAIVLGGCLAPEAAPAEEYSWDVSAVAGESEADPFLDTNLASVWATHHFDAVDDASGPYALASFLDPSTRISATLSREERTTLPPSTAFPALVTTTNDYSIGGRYLLRPSKWYFGGSYTTGDIEDAPPSLTLDASSRKYGLLAGKYLGDATTLEASFDASELGSEVAYAVSVDTLGVFSAGSLTSEERRNHASMRLLHVRRLRSLTYSLSGRVAASSGDVTVHTPAVTLPILFPPPPRPIFGPITEVTIPAHTTKFSIPRLKSYSIAGEVYPTVKIGVRVGYTRWDDDTPADDAYDVAATWFVTHHIGLQLTLSRQTIDETNGSVFTDADFDNTDTATIGAIGRF